MKSSPGRKYSAEEAIIRLERYCAFQERSKLEVRKKSGDMGIGADEADRIILDLERKGFLNESRFSEAYVSGKLRIKKWGRIKIRAGLRLKGISAEDTEKAINTIDQDLYYENLLFLARNKAHSLSNKHDEFAVRVKTSRFLMTRGYEGDLIRDALDALFSEQ